MAQLNAVEAEKGKYLGTNTRLERQSQSLKAQIGKVNNAISKLERRKSKLEGYMIKARPLLV